MGKTLQKEKKKRLRAETECSLLGTANKAIGKKKVNYNARVSDAFNACRYDDALEALRGMRASKQLPKLGAVQRWVRAADLAGTEELAAKLLAAILRASSSSFHSASATDGARSASQKSSPGGKTATITSEQATPKPSYLELIKGSALSTSNDSSTTSAPKVPVRRHAPWVPCLPSTSAPANACSTANGHAFDSASSASPAAPRPEDYAGKFKVIFHEPGPQRKPPSSYDLNIFVTEPGLIKLHNPMTPLRVDVPFVPGAFVMLNVLTQQECAQLVAAAEAMGFVPDVDYAAGTAMVSGLANVSAARTAAGGSFGDRASGCVWLADDSLLGPIFERCKPLMPPALCGGALAGINARFRLYRYDQHCVYRPHVDGAWPGSGTKDGQYEYDVYGDRISRLTFLVYLNEGFEGGSTTFYTPAEDEEECLEAYGVAPRVGNVLCFPHGDTSDALVHEGSCVTQGSKYVIRSDVLYMLPAGQKPGRPPAPTAAAKKSA